MSHAPDSTPWQAVIGLEIHIELNTKSKLFSSAPNHFGDEPNTNIDPVSTGQPGALPVLNELAVKKAIALGCALGSKIAKRSKFDRKSYFYPDSPRNFQITQFDEPIIIGGSISAEVEGERKTFAINRAHLEDDAGMLKHFSSFTGVDYNRAGVPLVEIVSEPCMHTSKEAVSYAMAIREIAQYVDASDCNMEEGSLRIDANISVRKEGEMALRNKTEVKNMNSFSALEMAIDAEIARQIAAYQANSTVAHEKVVTQGTYRWDSELGQTVLMRVKESADDYRYFPEPDLLPLIVTEEQIAAIRATLPELPQAKKLRYMQELALSEYNATILTANKKLADYFEEGLKVCSSAQALCNWITVEFVGRLKDKGSPIYHSGISSHNIAKLVNLIEEGKVTGKIAKMVADEMVASPSSLCEQIIASNPNYQTFSDSTAIERMVDDVIAANEQSVKDYRAGNLRAFGFLVGQVMKLCGGKAPPALVNELLNQKLG